ncbi:hypothetical protein A3Q56_00633 [Intoshia linei]|uniref:Uncharacterized protein n=1 Tax=Intoshia linei TaxID=1819745 RepID=A0A177BB98_9BILA|nr:hypothetical protein A3Q56_00633 [Intoshia linei]
MLNYKRIKFEDYLVQKKSKHLEKMKKSKIYNYFERHPPTIKNSHYTLPNFSQFKPIKIDFDFETIKPPNLTITNKNEKLFSLYQEIHQKIISETKKTDNLEKIENILKIKKPFLTEKSWISTYLNSEIDFQHLITEETKTFIQDWLKNNKDKICYLNCLNFDHEIIICSYFSFMLSFELIYLDLSLIDDLDELKLILNTNLERSQMQTNRIKFYLKPIKKKNPIFILLDTFENRHSFHYSRINSFLNKSKIPVVYMTNRKFRFHRLKCVHYEIKLNLMSVISYICEIGIKEGFHIDQAKLMNYFSNNSLNITQILSLLEFLIKTRFSIQ